MAEDKKNIPETAPPAEAPAPAVENAVVPEQPISESTLADAETVMLEHEGQAVLFEMGEAVPDPADAVTHAKVKEEPVAPEVPKAEKEQAQPPDLGKDAPAPAHSGKVVDFAAVREEAAKEEKKAIKQKSPKEKGKAAKPGKGRPPKTEKTAPEQTKPPKTGKTHAAPEEKVAPPAPEVPPTPRDATRAEKEEIVYLDLSDLHPFKDHPFGVRDDAEMKSLVESVRNGGVNQPALVRPREGGGYEIIAGHRRQMASQLAGYRNMPCIVRNMTDDEAILAMTDDNLRQRETILPSEKSLSLKMQYEAIKHQGARGDSAEAGKLSLESVGQRNGMSVKTVQRYIWLNDLVPELKQTMDDGKLSFTPAVEISRVRPKHQKYIAVSIEGQQASPSKGQAKRLRELDKENKLSPDVIDGILCEEKKKEDRDVIITGAELEKFFGKEATPRQMKDQIMTLLEDWKERQPPELAKPDKKMDMEK